ncbi:glycosyltransferase family 2 protein [Paratractidigestivibacter sp.]|uniref:glycosyltransferase family 2 protein n=1 Tax=Paratractidigestivibacter sp. TaxID=2847316 RepID=UPI002ACB175D|nr:glycosyltransferase family 2 protein [Paratractidigestivibacter sp.]
MISVCMATYNGEKFLGEQIDSILKCLSADDELVISDDGSTDSTRAMLAKYEEHNPGIKVVEGPGDGIIANFENAMSHSNGDVIFLSDQDDVWYANKIERVLEARRSTGANVIVHDARLVNVDGVPIGPTMFELRSSKSGFIKNLFKNSFVGCCMAIDKQVLDVALPIPCNVEMHDWWIGLAAELWYKTAFIDDRLIDYRRHGQNASSLAHHPIPKMISNRCHLAAELAKRSFGGETR